MVRTLSRALLAASLLVAAACAESHEPATDYSGAWLGEDRATLITISSDQRVGIHVVFDEGSCLLLGTGVVEGDAIVASDGARYPVAIEASALVVEDPVEGLLTGRYFRVELAD